MEGSGGSDARRLDAHGRDPRVLKEFGEDWPAGWNALGVPNQPEQLNDGHPLLTHTVGKDFAQLTASSKAVKLGLLAEGRHPREALDAVIVSYFLRGGDGMNHSRDLSNLTASETPEIMLLGGGGGAGKGSSGNGAGVGATGAGSGGVLGNNQGDAAAGAELSRPQSVDETAPGAYGILDERGESKQGERTEPGGSREPSPFPWRIAGYTPAEHVRIFREAKESGGHEARVL